LDARVYYFFLAHVTIAVLVIRISVAHSITFVS
jgi:hypothetical protein